MRTCCPLVKRGFNDTYTSTSRKHPIKRLDFIYISNLYQSFYRNQVIKYCHTRYALEALLLFLSKDFFYESQELVLIIT